MLFGLTEKLRFIKKLFAGMTIVLRMTFQKFSMYSADWSAALGWVDTLCSFSMASQDRHIPI
jgi:hypothetical protein